VRRRRAQAPVVQPCRNGPPLLPYHPRILAKPAEMTTLWPLAVWLPVSWSTT
jgi:hypothetical protein